MCNLPAGMRFERKHGVAVDYRKYNFDPDQQEKWQAYVHGASIVVKDVRRARKLFLIRNFGSFIGQRMNFTNAMCFPQPAEENALSSKQWQRTSSQCHWLFLSHGEALYLFGDLNVLRIDGYETADAFYKESYNLYGWEFVKKFVVYRHFRDLGWIVRDGISFGCDFLLYKDGVEVHHSSAGVRIVTAEEKLNDIILVGLKRELSNCKKVLLLAAIEEISVKGLDLSEMKSLKQIRLEVYMFQGWNWKKSRTTDLGSQTFDTTYDSGSGSDD